MTPREAKEFVIDRIVAEAQRENVPLSETERRMLYFTETYWMPYDFVEVNEAFERECDMPEYETKTANLIRSDLKQANPTDRKRWHEAVHILSKEDHYLLVMIGEARSRQLPLGLGSSRFAAGFSPIIMGLIIGVSIILLAFTAIWIHAWLQR